MARSEQPLALVPLPLARALCLALIMAQPPTAASHLVVEREDLGALGSGVPGHTVHYLEEDDALRHTRRRWGQERGSFPREEKGKFFAARDEVSRAEKVPFTAVAFYGDSLTKVWATSPGTHGGGGV